MQSVDIIIGGDLVPSFYNLDYFCNGDLNKIADEECCKILKNADLRIFNLETPITDAESPIIKDGANFAVPTNCINGIKALNSDIVSLANNHCKDQGETVLVETIKLLESNGIRTVGHMKKGKKNSSYVCYEKSGIRVAIIACAETEFTIANNREHGAVPYDAFYTNELIKELKRHNHAVIVLYHGGKEYYPYPAPYLAERCRLMTDNGADVILCQHSHCIGCYEKHNSGTIVYGQGNFIFHQKNNKPITREGLLVKVHISENESNVSFIPIVLDSNDAVCLAKGLEHERIILEFEKRSKKIKKENEIEHLFSMYADSQVESYLWKLQKGTLLKRVLRKIGILSKDNVFKKEELVKILNILQNEAHRELFIQGIKNIIEGE